MAKDNRGPNGRRLVPNPAGGLEGAEKLIEMDPDADKLEDLREKAQKRNATDADRKAFKQQMRKVAEARAAQRLADEQAGLRGIPLGPGDAVATAGGA